MTAAPPLQHMAACSGLHPRPTFELEIVSHTPLFTMVMNDSLKGLCPPYDAAPDGQHFVVLVPAGPPTLLTLVQNWTALFDR